MPTIRVKKETIDMLNAHAHSAGLHSQSATELEDGDFSMWIDNLVHRKLDSMLEPGKDWDDVIKELFASSWGQG